MSRENVEVVRRLFDGWGTEEWRGHVSEDVVWDATGVSLAGVSGVYRGHSGVERFFRDWLAPWEQPTVELVEIIDGGESVFTVMRWRARGRGSGVEVERDFHGIYLLRDGQIVRFCQRESRAEALEAAGLTE